jgi:hypothetical protein
MIIREDLGGRGRDLIEVPFGHLPGGTEENQGTTTRDNQCRGQDSDMGQ